ncbi:MAG: hypothetical protein GY838_05450 [bacterium]|nr:hypothetical protein [bacterium]
MKMLWRTVSFMILGLFAIPLTSCSDSGDSTPDFAVYLVDIYDEAYGDLSDEDNPHTSRVFANMDQEYVIAHARIRKPALLTSRDIATYCWDTHRIELTPRGVARWESAGKYEVPLQGIPVVVVVDGVTCYAAMIWNLLSSSWSRLPQFWSSALEGVLVTGCCMYPVGEDPPPDVRENDLVRGIMEQDGKLDEECGER